MSKQAVASPNAPTAIGPYSAALRVGQLVFVSGQVPINPGTGAMVDGDIGAMTRQVFQNISALLAAAGMSLARRGPHHGVPGRHERLRGRERRLPDLLQ
ncbi:MAG: Rid family hydrolase [Vicinamibacterales bacterium]